MGIGLLLASAASGCVSRTFVHPLDTIRSRLMVSTGKSCTFGSIAQDLIRADGFRGLYRGFGISVVMQAPAISTFLTTYDWAKVRLTEQQLVRSEYLQVTSPAVHLVCGFVAETVSAVFWVPMEVIKQRAQVRSVLKTSTSLSILRDLLRYEGPANLFKGYGLTVGVFGPYSMIYFMCYERFKADMSCYTFGDRHGVKKLTTSSIAACAASAGAIAAACTTPLDVIKTRLQTQDDVQLVRQGKDGSKTLPMSGKQNSVGGNQQQMYRSTWHAAKSIAQQEGVSGFFRGVSARVLWIMPSTAITMSTFEYLKSYFNLEK